MIGGAEVVGGTAGLAGCICRGAGGAGAVDTDTGRD